ncbi:DUF5333 domain-containing protein [Halocynthiibacter styelae]|uniref:DUF5333 domain-containing protein n=1 Tax=Halocynthiibacter styelae TaxID=2761955 RepID=A0A8J7IKQ1_9RHOB|nr:DUF5333 domain-containing protein [Paenihalocynthiibacter styelae]MBI1494918.1 DUF5333 domain-containing protein [Paenihalocynthiibacter styelae]
MSDIKTFFAAGVLAAVMAVPAAATGPVPLTENDAINNRLITAGVVRRIHKRCPDLTYKRVRSFMYLRSIHNLAQEQGYGADEIEAYIDDKDQEAHLYTFVDAWLTQRGAVEGNAESYCAVGRAEISAGSQIGNFLRTD